MFKINKQQYYTINEFSDITGIPARSIRTYCKDGKIKEAIKRGWMWFIPADNLKNPFIKKVMKEKQTPPK